MKNTVSLTLIELLVCPISQEPLSINEEGSHLISLKSGHRYPIQDGIPVLIAELAE